MHGEYDLTKLINGLESGMSNKSLAGTMKEVEARMQEDGRL